MSDISGRDVSLKSLNKIWMRRLHVVQEMEQWIAENLKDRGMYDEYDRSEDVKLAKAKEYLYGYLFWGRRSFPGSSDPLFFQDDGTIQDESLVTQMNHGEYNDFVHLLRNKINGISTIDAGSSDVSWDDVKDHVIGNSSGILKTLKDNLLEKGESNVDDHIIGLVLRYRCVGGFESNLHGSVPGNWKNVLPGFTECFASPLNHKFDSFYSLFNEDSIFGGHGDFFKMVDDNGGVLPEGKYEINPPFHLALLDQVATIVKNSFEHSMDSNLQVVMVVPDWSDAVFVTLLNYVCEILQSRGIVYTKRYHYEHSNGKPLSTRTRFYVLSGRRVSHSDVKSLFSSCRRMIYGSVSRTHLSCSSAQAKFDIATEKFSDAVIKFLEHGSYKSKNGHA